MMAPVRTSEWTGSIRAASCSTILRFEPDETSTTVGGHFVHPITFRARVPPRVPAPLRAASTSLDVNVLLHASNADGAEREKARAFMARCIAGPELMCLAWLTLTGYLRMATHPRPFDRPLAPEEALNNVEALLKLPHARAIGEEEGFLRTYRDITADVPTRGNRSIGRLGTTTGRRAS